MKIRLLALLTLAGLGIASATAQPSNAQVGVPSNQTINPQNSDTNNDPFNQGVEQNNFGGIMNLIHRANFGGAGYNPEFFTEQSQQIDEAAAAFRAKQQQRVKQGRAVQPTNQPTNQQGSTIIRLEPSGN